jgi:hypothetical protein
MGWAWAALIVAGLIGLLWVWLARRLDRLEVLIFRGPPPPAGG